MFCSIRHPLIIAPIAAQRQVLLTERLRTRSWTVISRAIPAPSINVCIFGKFDDDADRRANSAAVFANKDFVEGFASKFRPLLMTQEVKLLQAAPWGPHP